MICVSKWHVVVLLVISAGCSHGKDGGPAFDSALQEGTSKSKCPKESAQDPEKTEQEGGGIDPSSEHGTITQAINALKALGASTSDPKLNDGKLTALATCLEKMHKDGRICVSKKENPDYKGATVPDFKGGWAGDLIILNRKLVKDAGEGATAVAAGDPPTKSSTSSRQPSRTRRRMHRTMQKKTTTMTTPRASRTRKTRLRSSIKTRRKRPRRSRSRF